MNKKLISCILSATLIVGTSALFMGCGNNNEADANSTATSQNSNNASNTNNSTNNITEEKAKEVMLNKVPNGNITKFSYDADDNKPKYEGTVVANNLEYEVDVDAQTGEIIAFEQENLDNSPSNTANFIGEEKAKEIMLSKVPDGTFVSFKLDNDDDNGAKYEAELKKENMQYDISVNATNGDIIDFDSEPSN
ncbi:PepSY domain-containing protein [Clostridium tarantellae]|uniref:PepSY domain-containing protein n=1 Tax=Clostridium tarantellae TaxID=39493 RepID=A0A6I1MW08_9CLOT|nr:PepSY domain-containing protein [Clostridium tarantellae]MPQ44359.1 hypothetical protein [Clostridium tarantellae]